MTVKVTVGIPAYNNAATLRRTVESILNQTHGKCLLIISDDASTDATQKIGKALAAEYPSLTYIRQPFNLNHHGNFRFVLRQAKTPFFMWLAGDDYLEPTYVERALAVLEADPTIVTCVSRVRFVRPDGTLRIAEGTYPLMGDKIANLAAYLSNPTDNSRLFGLHRTAPLQQAFPVADFLIAYDWAAMAGTLLHGRHAEIPEILLVRDETPSSAYVEMVRKQVKSSLDRAFPGLRMSWDLVLRQKIPLQAPVLKALIALNLAKHIQYMRAYHPRYRRFARLLERHLIWRLMTSPVQV